MSIVTAPQLSEQELAILSTDIDEGHSGFRAPLPLATESRDRPSILVGYIPIQGGAAVSAVPLEAAQSQGAFENLERDLADLASACSGLVSAEQAGAVAIFPPVSSEHALEVSDSEAAAMLLDSLQLTASMPDTDCNLATDASVAHASQPDSHFSREEDLNMNAQAQSVTTEAANHRVPVESAMTVRQSSALETDGVLHDVQSTLDSLAGMAHGLSQQKLEIVKMREALEERRLATLERERQLAEREERLSQQEQRLQEEKQGIERVAEHNATVLAERSTALQALAETVDSRDRATTKRAEVLSQEQQSIDRQQNQLRARVQELDDREAGLQRQSGELADRFKQLLDAKERFGAIVKGFNETVRFNTTYSAISKTVGTGAEEA
ncbi:hypothetical protein ABKS89_24935 [Pseudomonas sp. LABIM340]|uniref:hypothetical protein n=1 Tax=Pseudomonas sp. LABIM340 TaxID=3156585 RepID=UPI0032AF8B0A